METKKRNLQGNPGELPKKILVRGPNWIGDHVMAKGFYDALAAAYPDSERVLLVPETVVGLGLEESFASVWTFPRSKSRWSLFRELSAKIRDERFHLGLSLPSSFSSALLFFLGGVPNRVGFSGDGNECLYTESLPWPGREAGRHKSSLYLDLIRLLGVPGNDSGERPLDEVGDPRGGDRRGILLAPGASIGLREWPEFGELARHLMNQYPDEPLELVGGPAEAKWESLVERATNRAPESSIGKTSLAELLEKCRNAKLVVANDSGVAHVAATLAKAPTVVLFGPGDPKYIRPLGPRVASVRLEGLSCSPCESARCRGPYGYQACLRGVGVDEALRSIESLIS